MKKLFTLVALLAVFLGAKAEWVEDYSIDYSQKTAFPFYVMGYVPEWVDGVMTDYGAQYGYKTDAEMDDFTGGTEVGTVTTEGGTVYHKVQLDNPAWHQYFIADGIKTEIDGSYKVTAMAKASEQVTVNVNMGWGWGEGQQAGGSVTIGTEWAEVEWEYSGIGGTSCNLVAQPGGSTATIEWKWLKVTHNAKPAKPVVWQEWLTSDGQPIIPDVEHTNKYMGDAETAWPAWATEGNPNGVWKGDQTGLICAWGKTKGRNLGENFKGDGEGYNPFPADITTDPDDPTNHVFVVHGAVADTEGDPSAWDNQFWIQSPKSWKAGETLKISFRYKCSKESVKTGTQIHKQNPSEYLIWHAIGDITFTNEWQTFDDTMTMGDDMAGGWSIAFNLNANDKDAIDFFFDNLSWQSMKLEEGYFLAGCNTETGLEYDLDNAVPFADEDGDFVATVGEAGKKDTYVNQVMISTVRGNDAQFKANTLKPSGSITNDPDNWMDYTAVTNSKLNLPGSGVWKVYLDTAYDAMAFEMLEGEEKEAVDIVTNATEIKIEAVEREYTAAEAEAAGVETPENPGNTWDNQFFLYSNRNLKPGEVTVLEFDYKATGPAKSSAAFQGIVAGNPDYITGAFSLEGDDAFDTEVKHYKKELTMPAKKWDGAAVDAVTYMTFDLACIKEANTYTFTNIKWYLKDDELNTAGQTLENLINETGEANFAIKIGAGTNPVPMGIENVAAKGAKTSTAIYNLAGQRVANSFKGIVVKDGKKFVK